METAQQAPALQAAAGIPAMPQPESSTHRATPSASPVAPEVKVEFENAFKVGMPSFRAQAQTLPSILGEVGDKSNVAIIVSEGLGDEQVWVQFQDYRQARDLPPIQGLTRRYCTVQPASVSSQPTAVLVGPGEVGYIPKYKDKWMLKVSAAHGRNEDGRSEEHTSELQSPCNLVCRLLLEKKKKKKKSRDFREEEQDDESGTR